MTRKPNIVVISAYGMSETSSNQIIDLPSILSGLSCKYYGIPGTAMQIVPENSGDSDKIIQILRQHSHSFEVITNQNADKLREMKMFLEDRFGPIYVVAKKQRVFQSIQFVLNFIKKYFGIEGKIDKFAIPNLYDDDREHGIFIASGPSVQHDTRKLRIKATEVHSILVKLLHSPSRDMFDHLKTHQPPPPSAAAHTENQKSAHRATGGGRKAHGNDKDGGCLSGLKAALGLGKKRGN